MQWQEIRKHYPEQWLLVEAIEAHSDAGKRILEQLAVVDSFADSATALKRYQQLHCAMPVREYYVFHSSRETLEIIEQRRLSVRRVERAILRTALRNAVEALK